MTTTKKAAPKGAASTPKKPAAKKPAVKKEAPVKDEGLKEGAKSAPVVKAKTEPANQPAETPKTKTPEKEGFDSVPTGQAGAQSDTTSAQPETKESQPDTKAVQADQANQAKEPAPDRPTVVIPYRANKAKGDELLYAIRSWEKHLPGVVIILVGDTLPSASERMLHIPHKPSSDNPQIDVASKMAAAIASDLVPERFIWSNDDIYCVSEITQADLEILKAMPGGLAVKGAAEGTYRDNGNRTLKALKDAGIDKPFDFAAHTPVVFEKEKLAQTLAKFKCTKEGHLVSSLYFNTHYPRVRPLILDNTGRGSVIASVFKENPNPKVMPTIFDTQKWVNNNDRGWKAVEPFLAKLFPKKSAFEK